MKRIGWILLVIGAVGVGFYPLMYLLVDTEFGLLSQKEDILLKSTTWNSVFYTHITLGGLALLSGWSQFMTRLRKKNLAFHRLLGKIYVGMVLLSALAGMYLGVYATGGIISQTGFVLLAIFWFASTLAAYCFIRKQNLYLHQKWMIYSYAACLAAVTLRVWLPLLMITFQDFMTAYRLVAWLCWVPNLAVAWYLTRSMQLSSAYTK